MLSSAEEPYEPRELKDHPVSNPLEGATAYVSKASPEPQDDTPPPDLDKEIIEAQQHIAAEGDKPFPLADPGEYYIGLWGGKPNYGCPYCGYATLEGSGAVELHILERIDRGNKRHLPALALK